MTCVYKNIEYFSSKLKILSRWKPKKIYVKISLLKRRYFKLFQIVFFFFSKILLQILFFYHIDYFDFAHLKYSSWCRYDKWHHKFKKKSCSNQVTILSWWQKQDLEPTRTTLNRLSWVILAPSLGKTQPHGVGIKGPVVAAWITHPLVNGGQFKIENLHGESGRDLEDIESPRVRNI